METPLNLLELEGLEYLLARIIDTYEKESGIPENERTQIREIAQYDKYKIRIEDGVHDVYVIYNFALEELYMQDNLCLARGYRVPEDLRDLYKEIPLLIDVTEFLFSYNIDLNRLEEKIYRATETITSLTERI